MWLCTSPDPNTSASLRSNAVHFPRRPSGLPRLTTREHLELVERSICDLAPNRVRRVAVTVQQRLGFVRPLERTEHVLRRERHRERDEPSREHLGIHGHVRVRTEEWCGRARPQPPKPREDLVEDDG